MALKDGEESHDLLSMTPYFECFHVFLSIFIYILLICNCSIIWKWKYCQFRLYWRSMSLGQYIWLKM